MATFDAHRSERFHRCVRQSGGARQVDFHRGAVADLAVNLDVAIRLLDEAEHHAQAEPGPPADLLATVVKKGSNTRLQIFRAAEMPATGIAHGEHDMPLPTDHVPIHVAT